jgi:hypothetical protein
MPTPEPTSGNLELLRRLTEAGVDFVIVGGVAATLHGSSIVTADLGLCTPFTREALTRLLPILRELGARFRVHPERPLLPDEPGRLAAFRHLLLDTREGPVDLLREIDGIGSWAEVEGASEWLDLGSFQVRVLGLDALIAAKRAAGRDKDLAALVELEAVRNLRRRSNPVREDEERE